MLGLTEVNVSAKAGALLSSQALRGPVQLGLAGCCPTSVELFEEKSEVRKFLEGHALAGVDQAADALI